MLTHPTLEEQADVEVWAALDTDVGTKAVKLATFWVGEELEKFVEVRRHAANSLGIPLDEALDTAETLIFENGDFAAAIPILTALVNEPEPDDGFGYYFSPARALYLLGWAHEMQGNDGQAVAAYWRLWHDYPSAAYALLAAAKLEEIEANFIYAHD